MTTNATVHDRLISPRQAGLMVGLHRSSIYRAIRTGAIPAVRLGHGRNRPLRIRECDLAAWLEPARREDD